MYGLDADIINLLQQQYGGYGQSNPYDQGQGAGNPYAQRTGNTYAESAPSQGAYGNGSNGTYGESRLDLSDPPPSWLLHFVGSGDVELSNLNASRDPNAILNECRDIDRGIDSIDRNLERLRFLQSRAIDDPDASQGTQTNREIDALSSETMTLYRNFGARIKAIKQQRESGEPRNKPQVGKVDRKLKSAINEYQQVESDFRKKLSEQMARQYRIVKPEATDEEVRAAIEDTSNNQVFSQAVNKSLYLFISEAKI